MAKKSIKENSEKKTSLKADAVEDKARTTGRKKMIRPGAGKKVVPKAAVKKSTAKKVAVKKNTKEKAGKKSAPKSARKPSTQKAAVAKSAPKKAVRHKTSTAAGSKKKKTVKNGVGYVKAAKLRQRAEAELVSHMARLDKISERDKDEIIHELGTYQIELEIQNEELRRAQVELEESRARLADLYNHAPVGYFTFDPKGRITTVNLAGADMLGSTREKLIKNIFSVFIHRKDSDKFHKHLRAVLQERKGQIVELLLRPGQSGVSKTYLRLETIPSIDEKGKVSEVRSTVSDITERVKVHKKLKKQHTLLRSIIDHTDVLMAYLDSDFNFVWANPSYVANCNVSLEYLSGSNHFDLFPHAENEAIFRQVLESGEPVFFKDKPFIIPNQPERGTTYWDWSLVPVKDTKGEVCNLVFSLRETTQFKKIEIKLAESEEQFRAIAETSIDIIFQINKKGTILYVSPSARSLGYSPEEVIGRLFNEFVASEDVARAQKIFSDILNGKRIKLESFRLIHTEGFLVNFEINANPLIKEGVIVGIQGVARDITERLEAEEKIRQIARFPAENPFPVMRLNNEGVILYANPASRLLLNKWQSNAGKPVPDKIRILVKKTCALGKILEVEETCGNIILSLNLVPIDNYKFVNIYGHDITYRKVAENKIIRQNATLTAMNVIFKAGMQCETDDELADETLLIVEQLTGSRFGFIGEITPDGLLHEIAIRTSGREMYSTNNKTGPLKPRRELRIAGLYSKVLQDSKAFMTNDPAAHTESIETPEGHPPLSSFMGVPLFYGDKTIGLIALANKDGGYLQEDVHTVQALTSAFVEILFKHRVEKALQKSEERGWYNAEMLKRLLDFTPIPVWTAHDPECRNVSVNKAAASLMGVNIDANVSVYDDTNEKKPQITIFRNGRELEQEEFPLHYAVKNGITVKDIEIELLLPDGRRRQLLGVSTALFGSDGRVTGGMAAYMDITERKKLENELLQVKQEWETTFDTVPDLIAVLDADYQIVRVNRAMAKRAGLAPQEFVGKKCFELIHGTSEPVEKCPYSITCKDHAEHRSELFEQRMGGYFLVTTTPLFDDRGTMTGAIHVARDINEQKKAEEKIVNLNRELQESLNKLEVTNENLRRSNEDLLHFASIVSHDLQEPLRTVSSFVQLIGKRYRDAFDEKGQTFMQHVVGGTNHMQKLLNDLLSFSRVGGGKLNLERISVQDIIIDVKHKLDRHIKESRAEITVDSLPDVYADKLQIFTLLQNLISNGLKYRSLDRPPRISVTGMQDDENECTLCVSDNGMGIDPRHIDRIFLIFQRLHLRNEYEGTGIGLAICKKIVERHGGRIWAESEPDKGSSFCFTLPLLKKTND